MLLSKNAKRLMLGYLLGAYTTSIGLGLVIVFAIPGSGATTTSRTTISPALDVALGLIALVIALAVHRGPSERLEARREKRKQAKEQKGPPRWQRELDKGSPWTAFAVGAALSLPGASYLVALDILHRQALSNAQTVLAVVAFCVIMLALVELPVLAFAVAPDWTLQTVQRFQDWIRRDGRKIAFWAALLVGILLILRGAIEALT
jgi:hypothetical protein